ncbi:hypothetical protein HJG60_009274 [Phyllostomus discolor]|uniref:Uncharacterized protein n=1 Tax=Phyllostomus discolor TaxID=89673 RepID=A0A833YSQ2_9CHIR|nr:hypothetical protein HJG60_009274 [Phyllostomus discolor]
MEPQQTGARIHSVQAPPFACGHTSGHVAASGERCWLCALRVLQVRKLKHRGSTHYSGLRSEVVRDLGQSHSRAMSLASQPWPPCVPSSSSREMWSPHSVAALDSPAPPAGCGCLVRSPGCSHSPPAS